MEYENLDLDHIIDELVQGLEPGKPLIQLPQKDIIVLTMKMRSYSMKNSPLVDIAPPVNICGDIHGQFGDLLRTLNTLGHPPETKWLFLGDYVDRGKQSLETVCLLFAYKLKYPNHFYILRGNHECATINKIYGFYDECKRRYNLNVWKSFIACFDCLPIAAVIDHKIFCCHGGISPDIRTLDDVRRVKRPTEVPDTGVMCDLLWSDPDKNTDMWGKNDRGVSFVFGKKALANFLQKHDLDLVVRAHQVVDDGYEFFGNRQLVTVFSAPNYCGEFQNAAGVMQVREDLQCSFEMLKPSKSDVNVMQRVEK